MSFADALKNSFVARFTGTDISVTQIAAVLVLTAILAVYIFFVYRFITKKTFYSKTFNISIASLAVITAAIILAIQSSIVISLGMVGALSIIRFRTAIKDPMDLCFMFWAIAVGICCGAHLAEISIILSAIMTVLVICLDRLPIAQPPMILVINMKEGSAEPTVLEIVERFCKYYKVRSRNSRESGTNLVIELRVKEEYELVQAVKSIEPVYSVSLVAHDGEVTF